MAAPGSFKIPVRWNPDTRAALKRYLVAQTVAVLLFLPYTARYMRPQSRYSFHWSPFDVFFLVSSILAVGGVFFFASRWLRSTNKRGIAEVCFLLAFLLGAVSAVEFLLDHTSRWAVHSRTICAGIWGAALVLMIVAGRAGILPRCARAVGTLCFLASPLIIVNLATLVTPPWFSSSRESLPEPGPGRRGDQARASVYVFLFDECSYDRLFPRRAGAVEGAAGSFPSEAYPNISAFARRSLVYHRAHSPSIMTDTSLPSILWQTDLAFAVGEAPPSFLRRDEAGDVVLVPAGELTGLFADAAREGYATYVAGFAHPYRFLLGPEVDYCWTSDFYAGVDSWSGRAKYHAALFLSRLSVPFTAGVRKALVDRLSRNAQRRRIRETHRIVLDIVRQGIGPTFAVFHYSLPHRPFVFAPEGGDARGVSGYLGNLRRADSLFGEAVERLKEKGLYESSLIVFLSDHAWRDDPDPARHRCGAESLTHVPLLIKAPFSKSAVHVRDRVKLSSLRRTLWTLAAVQGRGELDAALTEVVGTRAPTPKD